MPLQNRVTPFGEIIASPERGTLMGNRGCLHNDQRQLVRQFCSYKAWIACALEFKGRKRQLMTPGRYTELFFLDEATALAAGHRPCGECRKEDFKRFKAAWLEGNPTTISTTKPGVRDIDQRLHTERLAESGHKRVFQAMLKDLPNGVFVRHGDSPDAFLFWRGNLNQWTTAGYSASSLAAPDRIVDVLTPLSVVNALKAGYVPAVHHSFSAAGTPGRPSVGAQNPPIEDV